MFAVALYFWKPHAGFYVWPSFSMTFFFLDICLDTFRTFSRNVLDMFWIFLNMFGIFSTIFHMSGVYFIYVKG